MDPAVLLSICKHRVAVTGYGPTNVHHRVHHTNDSDLSLEYDALQKGGLQLSQLVLITRNLRVDVREGVFCCLNP